MARDVRTRCQEQRLEVCVSAYLLNHYSQVRAYTEIVIPLDSNQRNVCPRSFTQTESGIPVARLEFPSSHPRVSFVARATTNSFIHSIKVRGQLRFFLLPFIPSTHNFPVKCSRSPWQSISPESKDERTRFRSGGVVVTLFDTFECHVIP